LVQKTTLNTWHFFALDKVMVSGLKLFIYLLILFLSFECFAFNCKAPLKEPLTSEVLDAAVENCHIKTTTELRYILPKTFRSNFTFLRHSASAFATCIDPKRRNPRLILFSPKSDLILGMPWNPEMVGEFNCNGFETIELKADSTRLQFTLHSLEPIPPKGSLTPTQITPVLKCVLCHGENGTPIWPNYPNWKDGALEAYGFNDDTLIHDSAAARDYKRFLNQISEDGSASTLLWPTWSAANMEKARQGIYSEKINLIDENFGNLPPYQFASEPLKGGNYEYRPNVKLSEVINRMNTKKIYNQLKTNPLSRQLGFALAFISGDCSSKEMMKPLSRKVSKKILEAVPNPEVTGLVEKYTFHGRLGYRLASKEHFSDFVKFIGLKETDIEIDLHGDSKTSASGYNDGGNSGFGLLATMSIASDPRFNQFLLQDAYDMYGIGAHEIPTRSQDLCENLRKAMDE
jgi:hypothetical protein